jgi:hypothetical protein
MRTLKNLISLRQAAAAATLLVASQAQAGHISTAEFGPARAEDIADLVTEAFTQYFPHDRWSIFLYSSVTFSSRGEPHCYAIAGVTPMGQGRFPVKSYSSHAQRMESQSMTPGEQREFAASCARRAVQNLMSDELDNMYVRPGSKRGGRS